MEGKWRILGLAAAFCGGLALGGCGGGGGGGGSGSTDGGGTPPAAKTLSGVAAAGAAIIGNVFVKDSLGVEKHSAIEADGSYTVDVSDMTPPFKLKAVGTVANMDVTYCSVATQADVGGTINITPFTDLIVANIAGQIAQNYYAGVDTAKITTTAIQTQAESLANKLAPVLQAVGVSGSVDLLRQSFTPGDNLDKVLDIVKVSIDPQTAAVEITNIVDNSQVTGTVGGTLTGSLTAPTATELSDIDKIRAGINAFVGKLSAGTASPTDPTLVALLAPAFLNDGENRDQFLMNATSDKSVLGMTVSGISFVEGSTGVSDGQAKVVFTITQPNQSQTVQTIEWFFQKDQATGTWAALGNERIVKCDIYASAFYVQDAPSPSSVHSMGTGIGLSIQDDYNSSGAVKAIVTGPGLPNGSATLYNNLSNTSSNADGQFTLDPTGADMNNVVWLNQSGYGPAERAANDASIGSAFPAGQEANIPYTITLYDAQDSVIATYSQSLLYRPYKLSELANAPFATLTKPASLADLSSLPLNSAATIQWSLAQGTSPDWIDVEVSGTVNGQPQYVRLESNLSSSQTSVTGTINAPDGFTPNGGGIWLSVADGHGRELSTSIQTW